MDVFSQTWVLNNSRAGKTSFAEKGIFRKTLLLIVWQLLGDYLKICITSRAQEPASSTKQESIEGDRVNPPNLTQPELM